MKKEKAKGTTKVEVEPTVNSTPVGKEGGGLAEPTVVKKVVEKVVKNEGVTIEVESKCAWCGAGKFTQTIVFCSEACKNSYLAHKGFDY